MAGKLQFTLEEYQDAARKYRKDLLMLPIIGIQDTLKFMTGRPGIRYKESVAALNGNAQFAPYKPSRRSNFNLDLDFRTLETFFGSVVAQFEPNSAISTLLGAIGDTKGDGQMQTPTAKHVLALIAKSLSENLNNAIFRGVRNASGDTTDDLFDGFDTITSKEMADGKIAASEGNYMKLTEAVTKANAVDIAKEIMWSMDQHLRAQTCYMFCSQDFADKYNEAYLLTHAGINYNNQYNQVAVEGSNGKLIICPLANKADSNFIHVTPKINMLVGYDQMGDTESVMVKEYEPFILSYIATMFFGVQFESIDKRRLKVVELAGSNGSSTSGNAGGSTGGSTGTSTGGSTDSGSNAGSNTGNTGSGSNTGGSTGSNSGGGTTNPDDNFGGDE